MKTLLVPSVFTVLFRLSSFSTERIYHKTTTIRLVLVLRFLFFCFCHRFFENLSFFILFLFINNYWSILNIFEQFVISSHFWKLKTWRASKLSWDGIRCIIYCVNPLLWITEAPNFFRASVLTLHLGTLNYISISFEEQY